MTGRSAVYARGGLVATSQPLATAAGVEVLASGGNAADAAVAIMGVLYVVEPMMCGLGGDAFVLHYRAADRSVTAFCGSGAAPALATPEAYAARGHVERMPSAGMLAVSVPGAVDATWELLRRFGSGRLDLPRLWRRAVAHAEAHPLPPKAAAHYANAPPYFRRGLEGRPPRGGDVVRHPELAATLAAIAEHGPDWFYRGPFAEALEAYSLARSGLLRAGDLAAHRTWVGPPLWVEACGLRVHVPPPPSHGLVLLEELGIVAGDAALDPLTAEGAHLLIEAKKRAFADRLGFAGDPARTRVPLRALLSPEYLRARRATIDARRASAVEVVAGEPQAYEAAGEETTSFVVLDGEGNAASVIISNFASWGSGEVVEGTGVLLNNRAHAFSLRPGHPNRLEPGKRTMHTLHCYLATDAEGRLALLGGTPGGDNQPQWNLQVLMHLLRGGCDPQEAVERPRWSSQPGTTPEPMPGAAYGLAIEAGFPAGVPEALAAMGHALQAVPRWGGGGAAQLIARAGLWRWRGGRAAGVAAQEDPFAQEVFAAGSDPRADGCAVGL